LIQEREQFKENIKHLEISIANKDKDIKGTYENFDEEKEMNSRQIREK
jgi:hypothetical protein